MEVPDLSDKLKPLTLEPINSRRYHKVQIVQKGRKDVIFPVLYGTSVENKLFPFSQKGTEIC